MDAATNNQNPKTARLIRFTGSQATIRPSAADRGFLKDLAQLPITSSDLADRHHYGHLKGTSTRSLSRLGAAGLITGKLPYRTGSAPLRTYPFASRAIAKAYGGRLPATGAKQTELHELMTTRMHYAHGYSHQAADFRRVSDSLHSGSAAVPRCDRTRSIPPQTARRSGSRSTAATTPHRCSPGARRTSTHEHRERSRQRCLAGNRIIYRGLTLSALQHRILARLMNAQFATGSRPGFRRYAQRAQCQRDTAARALRAQSGADLGLRLVHAPGHRAQAPEGALESATPVPTRFDGYGNLTGI